MGTYASTGDIQARIPWVAFSTTSKPNLTQIGQWITEAEAYLTGAMRAGGISTPVTDASGIEVVTGWACDYAEARTRNALSAAGGESPNDSAAALLDHFWSVVNDIKSNPAFYEAMLSGSGSSSTRHLRGYVLDNADSKTIAGGDFDPVFSKEDLEDQF